jgi:hypothetical protein
MLLAAFRLGHIGEPPTWGLWPTVACLGLGLWGVLARVKLPRVPPKRR